MVRILLKNIQIMILLTTLKMPQNCFASLQEQPQRRDGFKPHIRRTHHLSQNVKPERSTVYLRCSFLSRNFASVRPSIYTKIFVQRL